MNAAVFCEMHCTVSKAAQMILKGSLSVLLNEAALTDPFPQISWHLSSNSYVENLHTKACMYCSNHLQKKVTPF